MRELLTSSLLRVRPGVAVEPAAVSRRAIVAQAAGVLSLAAASSFSLSAAARPKEKSALVSVGEIRVRVRRPGRHLSRELRAEVERAIARLEFGEKNGKDRYLLDATLVRMRTVTRRDEAETSCVVSATLRRLRGGQLHAMLRGRARAIDDVEQQTRLERRALEAAVRSALGRVPEAI